MKTEAGGQPRRHDDGLMRLTAFIAVSGGGLALASPCW